MSNPCFIYRNPWFSCRQLSTSSTLPAIYVGRSTYIVFCTRTRRAYERFVNEGGGGCRIIQMGKYIYIWMCAGNYSGVCLLIYSKSQSMVPLRSPVPQRTGEASSTDHVVVQFRDHNYDSVVDPSMYVWKGFLKFFRHILIQISEYYEFLLPDHVIHWEGKCRFVSVVRDSVYCIYLYFSSPQNSGEYSLASSCRCPRPGLQIWRQLWRQYGFPITPEWGRHILHPIFALPEGSHLLICCSPFGWGVFYVWS